MLKYHITVLANTCAPSFLPSFPAFKSKYTPLSCFLLCVCVVGGVCAMGEKRGFEFEDVPRRIDLVKSFHDTRVRLILYVMIIIIISYNEYIHREKKRDKPTTCVR